MSEKFPHSEYKNGVNGSSPVTNGQNTESEELEINVFKIFNLLLQYKWTLIVIVLLFTIGAAVLARLQTPVYFSSGTIFISESKNRYSYAGSDLSNLLTTTYGIGVGSTIANELMILRSRTMSEDLADSIIALRFDPEGNKFPILWRDFPTDSSEISRDFVASKIRTAMDARQIGGTDLVSIGYESFSPYEAAYLSNLTMDTYSRLSTNQNKLMTSSALSFLKEERFNIEQQLLVMEDSLRQFMDETKLVDIDTQTRQIINEIANFETRKQDLEVSIVAIDAALASLEEQMEAIKPGLKEQFSASIPPLIERYQFELSELKTERFLLLTENPGLENRTDYPRLNEINRKISDLEDEIGRLTEEILQSGSDIFLTFLARDNVGIGQRIIAINEEYLRNTLRKSEIESQMKVVNRNLEELDAQFELLPEEMIAFGRIQRDVKINEQLYLLVSNQYAEMTLWERTQFGMGRPLDYARVTTNPISPKETIWIILGFLLGGVVGIGFILLREAMNDKINSTDILKSFNYAFLGAIPDFKILNDVNPLERTQIDDRSVSNQLITFLDHISPLSEAYRRLRINVVYANPDKHYNVIMVTSANKGEGKSTVAANLAVTFSEAEKSVLIIDLDLRRPTQHKVFGENREPGLTETLFETVSLSEIIRSTVAPNVDLLTVGKKTPEPATVLDSKRLKQLIDRLKDRYDHIILDTAPYGIISDSASLLRLVDGLVVVSRFNTTTKQELEFTLDGLSHLKADVLGLVLNAFDPEKSTDYYTNYSYYKRTYYSDYYKEEV